MPRGGVISMKIFPQMKIFPLNKGGKKAQP